MQHKDTATGGGGPPQPTLRMKEIMGENYEKASSNNEMSDWNYGEGLDLKYEIFSQMN